MSNAKPKLIWLQSLTCGGNTHSFFANDEFLEIMDLFEIIHHPIIETPYTLKNISKKILDCDILVLEGAFSKTGVIKSGVEVFDLAKKYAKKAKHIITVGSCATFGGVFRQNDIDNIGGFCFDGETPNTNYKTFKKKMISISGCPAHPKWLGDALKMIAYNLTINKDKFHRPLEVYGYSSHAGCTRNEYFEWKVDAKSYGTKEGCLFYEQGCQGPYTHANCNKTLWNNISSKTRVGTPCFGCTEPTFPSMNLWKTKTNMGIPANMPFSVSKKAYLTSVGIAKSFSIKRLSNPLIEYKNGN